MSEISKKSLKQNLLHLECHFTWILLKEDVDLDELEERIAVQINFLPTRSKVRNYNLLAYVKYLNGKKEEALENLQKAEETVKTEYPEEIEMRSLVTWGNYAWVYYRMDKLTEVQTYIKKVESICKQHGHGSPYKMKHPQVYCEKGWAFLKFGGKYYKKAKESFAKALEEEAENPEYNSGYAITVYRLEDYCERKSAAEGSSLEPLKKAVKLNPDDPFVVPLLALKLQEIDKAKEGEEYIKKALGKHPDISYVLRYAAIFYRKKGDVERALELLKKALSLTPNSGFLHHQTGICYRTQYFKIKASKGTHQDREQLAELIRLGIFHFIKVVEHKTKFFYAYLDLASMYAEGKELQKAEETFQKAFAMKNLTDTEKQQFHFGYGRFQAFHKRSESEAVKHYLAGLKIENESFERNKCKYYLKTLIEKKSMRGSTDAKSLGILGFIHQLDGEKLLAIGCYEQALKMDHDNQEYLSALLDLRLSLQT
ncbi:interferon-induced protein with tetratricopeptide repeats 5-like isoform X2 [Rhineura floridana]|uniref:interferon-induced protein with tetratricopeptide repeats 5-like isoform X2 n=1 Tax=Rhineura floridana TaxID=261503 RepID=UPI002AC82D06|nr:interferon-induced protein with tetratricopeptide repeats 5-like isoform X2 [Rhineura floridana]